MRYAVIFGTACGLAVNGYGQAPSVESKRLQAGEARAGSGVSSVFEDDQIKSVIPSGWKVARVEEGAINEYPALTGASIPYGKNGVALTKHGYTLALKHTAGHSSPIGRFGEVFRMAWLPDVADEDGCARFLGEYPFPVNRDLIFISMTFDIDDQAGINTCAFREGGPRRWFAGYFTVAKRAWFFASNGPNCAEKVYTLTSGAKTPAELPHADDPTLRKTIGEAIGIVSSIHYKRCPPARFSDTP